MGELLRNFGVEWKLLFAQAVNFSLLLFVLWKFLYRPLLNVLRERREKVAEGLRAAKEADEKMRAIEKEREGMLSDVRKKEIEILEKAEIRARDKHKEIVKEANAKASEIMEEGKRRAGEERAKSLETLYGESAELVKAALIKVFEKSPEQLEEKLIEDSLKELKNVKI